MTFGLVAVIAVDFSDQRSVAHASLEPGQQTDFTLSDYIVTVTNRTADRRGAPVAPVEDIVVIPPLNVQMPELSFGSIVPDAVQPRGGSSVTGFLYALVSTESAPPEASKPELNIAEVPIERVEQSEPVQKIHCEIISGAKRCKITYE